MAGQGSFGWYELTTPDPAAAETFYTTVVGWGSEAFAGDIPYTVLTAGGKGAAGLSAPPPGGAGKLGWAGYVGVPDTDVAAASLTQAGGKVLEGPGDIPGVGRYAVVADPQGVGFNLLTPVGMEGQNPVPGSVGTIGWHELHTTDWPAAFAFYSGQFGWAKGEAMDMGPMGTYQIITDGGEGIGAMLNSPNMPAPTWLFYFNVAGIDAAIDKINAGGGKVLMGPHEVPTGAWIVQATDPQGLMFALVGPK